MEEKWKMLIGYGGLYKVSTLGRVMSFKRCKEGKIMSPNLITSGYHKVILTSKYGKQKPYTVHKLVALTFIGPRKDGYEINHKNGNKLDNRLENLEICTRHENMLHSFKIGHHKPNYAMMGIKGINNPTSKQILQISKDGSILNTYPSVTEAAEKYGITKVAISNCACGRTKSSAGYIWKYKY